MDNIDNTIWEILGISETKDEKKITQAYRDRLSDNNPEDKPEQFKQLRNAYEEALAYAKKPETTVDKEIDEWLKDLNDLYDDFSRRKKVECWEELFDRDICKSISGHMRIEDELLSFLMDKYLLGNDVFLCMDRHFSFLERKEELYEKYPRDFINNVIINGILYPDILPLTMFIPGEDGEECQKYIAIYNSIRLEEDSKDKVRELESLKEKHPYGDAWICVWKARFEDPEYINELKKIAEEHADEFYYWLLLGGEYYYVKDYEKAEAVCEKLMEQYKDERRLRYLYADVLEAQEKYDEAMKQFNEIMNMANGDVKILMEMDERRKRINPFIIERKKERLQEDPEDIQARIDLCWAYIQNDFETEAQEVFSSMKEEETPPFDYYNILSNLTYFTKDYAKGVEALKKLIEVIDELPEDSEKNKSRKKRKGEMYNRMAYFYQELNDDENAEKAYEKALEIADDKAAVLTAITQMAFRKEDYEKAREYAQRLIEEKPDSSYGHALLAYAYFYLHHDQEAYDTVNRSLDMDGSDMALYVLKIRILLRNNAFEEAERVIEYLESFDLKEDPSVLYVRGLLTETRDKDNPKAKEYYERSLEKIGDDGANYGMMDDLYYHLLCIIGDGLDGNKKEDREKMMEICEKGLSFNNRNKDLLEYKGWLLLKGKQFEESLKIYEDLEKDVNHTGYIDSQLGYLYYQDLEHKAKESRDHYLKALEKGYDSGARFYIGMCEMYMGHLDEAEQQFLILKENRPDSIDPYLRLSTIYEMKNDLDKALEMADKLIDVIRDRQDDVSRYYLRKVQVLRRRKEPEEAIKVLKYIADRYQYPAKKKIFDIYLQAGMYKEAEKELWKWKWDGEYYDAQVTLNVLRGNFRKAEQLMNSHGKSIDKWRYIVLTQLLARAKEDYINEEKSCREWQETNSDIVQVYGHLAYCMFHQNNVEKQHEYANQAFEENEKRLEEYSTEQTLYQTRKYRLFTLLGRMKEAEELAEKIRKMPLCESCPYSSCKDLEVFVMEAAEIMGDNEKALLLARQGNEEYPDEEDFVIMKNMMERKEKRSC